MLEAMRRGYMGGASWRAMALFAPPGDGGGNGGGDGGTGSDGGDADGGSGDDGGDDDKSADKKGGDSDKKADDKKGKDKKGQDDKGDKGDKGKKKGNLLGLGEDGESGDDNKDGDKSDKEGDDEKKPRAPEKYEPFKLPDGMSLDDNLAKTFTDKVAKKLDLTQEQAQGLVDYEVERQAEFVKNVQDTYDFWEKASKDDAEIGGAKMSDTVKFAQAALNDETKGGIGNKALRGMLVRTGLANHPEVLRAFSKVGRMLAEYNTKNDKGDAGDGDVDARLAKMYPSTAKKT